jgi:hypothetical protein
MIFGGLLFLNDSSLKTVMDNMLKLLAITFFVPRVSLKSCTGHKMESGNSVTIKLKNNRRLDLHSSQQHYQEADPGIQQICNFQA